MSILAEMRSRLLLTAALALALAGVLPVAEAAAVKYASPSGSGNCATPATACSLESALAAAAVGETVTALRGPAAPDYSRAADVAVPDGVVLAGEDGTRLPVIAFTGGAEGLRLATSDRQTGAVRRLELRRTGGEGAVLTGGAGNASASQSLIVNSSAGAGARLAGGGRLALGDTVVRTTAANQVAVDSIKGSMSLRNVTALATGATSTAVRAETSGLVAVGPPPGCRATDVGNVAARSVIARGSSFDFARTTNAPTCVVAPLQPTATLTIGSSNFRADKLSGAPDQSPGGNQTSAAQTANAAVFADATGADFHQSPTSPTVNAGENAQLGTADLDGDARLLEAGPDIGADEMIPPPAVVTFGAAGIGPTTATFGGAATTNGLKTFGLFLYGRTTNYDKATALQEVGAAPVSAAVSGLTGGTTYHLQFAAVSVNANSTQVRGAFGMDQLFTTQRPYAGGGSGRRSTRFRIVRVVRRDGFTRVTVAVPGAGRLSARQVGRSSARLVRPARRAIRRAGRVQLALRPTAAGRRALRVGRRRIRARVRFTFDPRAAGANRTRTKAIGIRRKASRRR